MNMHISKLTDWILKRRADHAVEMSELEHIRDRMYANLSKVIRFEYEVLSAGVRISFTMCDGEMSFPVGDEQMEDGKTTHESCRDFPRTKHNLGVLKKIVACLEEREGGPPQDEFVFVVFVYDNHYDPEHHVFVDRQTALDYARKSADDFIKYYGDMPHYDNSIHTDGLNTLFSEQGEERWEVTVIRSKLK